jgi:hypothetical protein
MHFCQMLQGISVLPPLMDSRERACMRATCMPIYYPMLINGLLGVERYMP